MCNTTASIFRYNMTDKKAFQRLPTTVKPVHYALQIEPDLEQFSFHGTNCVSVNVNP